MQHPHQNKKNLDAAKYKEYFKKIMGVMYKVGTEFLEENIEYCLIGGIAVFLLQMWISQITLRCGNFLLAGSKLLILYLNLIESCLCE